MPEAPVICPDCRQANPADSHFCEECGVGLISSCHACGAELSLTARFCRSCGTAVEHAGISDPAAGRKVVTVLFADLAGSTAFQERLDAESVRAVMERFYEVMRAVIEEHDGRLEKFIGDAVVAVFGAPQVREDDALRAVRAAASMSSALERLNDELERDFALRLDMRVGVNTGELVVARGSADGRLDDPDIVVGDVMNTAARLEQAAGAGEILIGQETGRLVRNGVRLERVEPLALKGKSQAVPAWRLTSTEPLEGLGGVAPEAPLVGRQRELARLRAAFDDAIASRACRLVTVIGSPGVGKTRLAHEFARQLRDDAIVVEGHCEPSGEGITLLPVAEVLRGLARIGEADPPELVREKLGALVEDDAERGRLVERAAGVLGVATPSSAEETFWALRRGLELVALRRPIVIVLDDLHWGQPMFLDLIEHLIDWVAAAPVLLVALARPELRELREALASGRRATDVIELAPLDERESHELVIGLLEGGELPPALADRILRSSEGNPLFLSEMLRMLIDEGALRRRDDTWVAAGDLGEIEVPPTIHALLSARIERLGSDERSVVERAAVIGKEFYRGAVAELVAPPVKPGIDGHLEALRRKDMVEPEGTYWIDEPVYRFHHVLIRDAAYRSLLKEARAELHERFADWLQEKAGELVGEHEEVIAFHLEQAHAYRRELGPLTERGRGLGERAASRLLSVGRRALAREDLAAAANLLRRALDCDGGSEPEILWDLSEALLSAGEPAKAGALVARFADGAGEDRRRWARAHVLEAQLANLSGAEEVAQTAEAVSSAAQVLAELGDREGEAKAWHVTAGAQVRLGKVGAVEESLDRALAAARAANDGRRITAVLTGAPRAALWGPSPVVRASGRCLDVVRILRMTPGNRHVEAIALRCQAVLEAMRGRFEAAREILASGQATLEELGLTLELQESAMHAGIVELLAGRAEAAAEHLRNARDGFESLGVLPGAAQAAALLARALVEQGGREAEAIDQTRFAEEHCGEDLKTTIAWCSARAQALARQGETEKAIELGRRAVQLAEPTDALADKADAAMALAGVLLDAGHEEEAREVAAGARELYGMKGHTVGAQCAARLTDGGRRGRGERVVAAASDGQPRRSELGDHAPERLLSEHMRRIAAHDLARCLELYAEEHVLVDHRSLSWEPMRGRESQGELLGSAFASVPDIEYSIDDVLACDQRVIAVRQTWRGHAADGGGEIELRLGIVNVIEDGVLVSADQYEYDDDEAMLARYTELGGGSPLLLGDRAPERVFAEVHRHFNLHDLESSIALYAENWVEVDHRDVGWEERHGREGGTMMLRSAYETLPDLRMEVDEVLACDDRVMALRCRFCGHGADGGGEAELDVGRVVLIEDGLWVRSEYYDYHDDTGMLARFEELGGRRESALGDRPPEAWHAEYARRIATHDVARCLELYAQDQVRLDHRSLPWEPVRGRAGMEETLSSVFATVPDIAVVDDEVVACDERVIAVRVTWRGHAQDGGGDIEVRFGTVDVIEDGTLVSTDLYEYDDDAAMLARFEELSGTFVALVDRAPELILAEWQTRIDAHDVAHCLELYDEDWTCIDHRLLSWEPLRGLAAAESLLRSIFALMPDARIELEEVLACDERVLLVQMTWRGHAADGGGEMAVCAGFVNVIEQGRIRSTDFYDPEDRKAMSARYAELGGGLGTLGDQQPERHFAEFARSYARGDAEGVAKLYAEDWNLTDHRQLGWDEMRGSDAIAAAVDTANGSSLDMRLEVDEVIACDERVIAVRVAYRGHTIEGGGAYEILVGQVSRLNNDGLWLSADQYDADHREAMLARYTELTEKTSGDAPASARDTPKRGDADGHHPDAAVLGGGGPD